MNNNGQSSLATAIPLQSPQFDRHRVEFGQPSPEGAGDSISGAKPIDSLILKSKAPPDIKHYAALRARSVYAGQKSRLEGMRAGLEAQWTLINAQAVKVTSRLQSIDRFVATIKYEFPNPGAQRLAWAATGMAVTVMAISWANMASWAAPTLQSWVLAGFYSTPAAIVPFVAKVLLDRTRKSDWALTGCVLGLMLVAAVGYFWSFAELYATAQPSMTDLLNGVESVRAHLPSMFLGFQILLEGIGTTGLFLGAELRRFPKPYWEPNPEYDLVAAEADRLQALSLNLTEQIGRITEQIAKTGPQEELFEVQLSAYTNLYGEAERTAEQARRAYADAQDRLAATECQLKRSEGAVKGISALSPL